MIKVLPLALIFALSSPVLAAESCGLRSAKLVAAGDAKKIASMFPKDLLVEGPMASLIQYVGNVSKLEEVAKWRFGQSSQMSVAHPMMKQVGNTVAYTGSFINAESDKLGPIQFHIASKPGNDCTVLAVQVHTGMN
jgi:hypothetical protein